MKVLVLVMTILALPGMAAADDLAVTVYNSNLGVVSETRSLEFSKGVNQLAFRDVPSSIDAASVRFGIIGTGHNVTILEQNYAYDLVGPDKLYAKYVDKDIELAGEGGAFYAGTLLAYTGGAITLQDKSGRIKVVQLESVTEVNFPSLPEGLITRPTLFWNYNSDYSGKLDCQVSYQTDDMNWSAEYVGLLSTDETKLGLSGWASITNNSGKTFTDATLKLVAGDINRVQPRGGRGLKMGVASLDEAGYGGFEEKAFFEYHLYTLPRKATLANSEIKQISLFEPAETSVQKVYMYRPERDPEKVAVALNFKNSASTGLGQPLPAGRMRIFKTDTDGSLILLGEDQIDHTPKDEELNIQVGFAFDITAEQRLMNQTRVSPKVDEQDLEIELNNRKDVSVTVEVEKKLYGNWEILDSSLEFEKKDANTVVFKVAIKANDSNILKFKVRNYMR